MPEPQVVVQVDGRLVKVPVIYRDKPLTVFHWGGWVIVALYLGYRLLRWIGRE